MMSRCRPSRITHGIAGLAVLQLSHRLRIDRDLGRHTQRGLVAGHDIRNVDDQGAILPAIDSGYDVFLLSICVAVVKAVAGGTVALLGECYLGYVSRMTKASPSATMRANIKGQAAYCASARVPCSPPASTPQPTRTPGL